VYLLDTNICIAIINENAIVLPLFYSHFARCHIATVTIAELYKGVYCSRRVEGNRDRVSRFLDLIPYIIDFDRAAAEEFGKIQGELRKKGKPTGEMDALIAAMARSRGDVLVTNNVRHFENISGLAIANWLE